MKNQKSARMPKSLWCVVLALLEDVDTPRSLTVKLLIEHEEWGQLLELSNPPARHLTADSYFKDAVVTDLLRKCRDVGDPSEMADQRRLRAVGAFLQAEKACKATNDRLDPYLYNGPFEDPRDLRIAEYLGEAKRFIADVLGPLPREFAPKHGPGATFRDRGVRSLLPDKMSSRPTITSQARDLLPFWVRTSWFRGLCSDNPYRTDPETIRGNRFTTVAKDALKDRGICIEPSLNIFFQLGVGKLIRDRLLRIGIDLDNGQHLHRRMAKEGSLNCRYATVDLSNASDTVSKKLVKLLLPADWYELLDSLRSPVTQVPDFTRWVKEAQVEYDYKQYKDRQYYLEKFSSMGNGFTFELETLIFLSLACVSARHAGVDPVLPGHNVCVFGDDIIVPVESSRNLLAMLRFCGFTPNERKTFTEGWFRESCGGDYFRGEPVRAHFLEEYPDETPHWISLANGLRRVASQYDSLSDDLHFVRRAWFRVLDNIPSHIRRLRGPVRYGDQVIHDVPSSWQLTKRQGGAWYIRGISQKPIRIPLQRWGGAGLQLACMAYGMGPTASPRGEVEGIRYTWLSVS